MGEAELYAGRRREADDVTNLNQINSQRQLLRVFGGLNEGYACSEAELSEEKNFSSRGYPALETRKPRRKVREAAGMNGMYHLNGLLTVEGTTLRYAPDDGSAAVELKGALSDNEKRLVGMGTKVLIWPDKMSFDTVSGTLSALGSSWQQGGVSLTVTPCDAAGVVYTPNLFGATEPESPENGDVWLKQAEDAPWSYRDALKLYSTAGGWQNILLNYCLHTESSGGQRLLVYDTEKGLWHEEDATGWAMCSTGRQLYLWDKEAIWAADGSREASGEEDTVEYEAVTGDIGLGSPDDKYCSRVTVRLDAMERTVVTLWASFDGGEWQEMGRVDTAGKRVRVNLPFVPTRHDTMRLRLTGKGQIAVRSIAMTLSSSEGGRVNGGVPRRG